MKTFKKYLFGFAIIATILIPQMAIAQTNTNTPTAPSTAQCDELRRQFENAGGENPIAGLPQYCSVGEVYTKFINTALYLVGIVAVIAVIYGGYLYMTAGGNETQAKKGRSVLTWAIIGLIVVVIAAVLVNIVLKWIVENRFV
jgi:hypothetical protein